MRIRGLNHFTLPVRDRYRAARFYSTIFNCELDHESAPDRVAKGLARSLQVGVSLCDGIELDCFEQDFGQPTVEQAHPHHAFDIRPEDVPQWIEQLTYWGVPFVGPMTRAGTKGCEIYFNDPDGNHLELHCSNYPVELREKLPVGPYDKSAVVIHQWPTAEREQEVDALFEEKLARMRARRAAL
ncbi:MAG TPA: VOC family protein [Chloroflexota bacterium]|nr:VOC family protein [Chloroflexota bacterium]